MSSTPKGPGKRIIVCCDGTWKDSDGVPDFPSNVTRITRCIKNSGYDPIGDKEIPQVKYYQCGVGNDGGAISSLIGGATGKGIAENIREAYSFICNNYDTGDEIFLIGFSRGAFTVRSISSLMRSIGLLTRKGLVYLYTIFKDWENQDKRFWRNPYTAWPNRPNGDVNSPEYQRELLASELTRFDVTIKACGVFDTVGSLGIPAIGILPQFFKQHLTFVDTKVEANIENAFQALALDERRRPFTPTIWEKPDGQENPKQLKQVWFAGVHSDIGGGYSDSELANLTLAWMMSQLENMIDFDPSYLLEQQRETIQSFKGTSGHLRPWGLGHVHNSFTPQYWLAGSKTRTPDNYHQIEQWHWATFFGIHRYHDKPTRLENTRQMVHKSVRVRKAHEGYDCPALAGWQWKSNITDPSKPGEWFKETSSKSVPFLHMDEDELGEVEKILLKHWSPEIYNDMPNMSPSSHVTIPRKKSVTYPKDKPHSVVTEIHGDGDMTTTTNNKPPNGHEDSSLSQPPRRAFTTPSEM